MVEKRKERGPYIMKKQDYVALEDRPGYPWEELDKRIEADRKRNPYIDLTEVALQGGSPGRGKRRTLKVHSR